MLCIRIPGRDNLPEKVSCKNQEGARSPMVRFLYKHRSVKQVTLIHDGFRRALRAEKDDWVPRDLPDVTKLVPSLLKLLRGLEIGPKTKHWVLVIRFGSPQKTLVLKRSDKKPGRGRGSKKLSLTLNNGSSEPSTWFETFPDPINETN